MLNRIECRTAGRVAQIAFATISLLVFAFASHQTRAAPEITAPPSAAPADATVPEPAAPAPDDSPPAEKPRENPGLINEIGKLFSNPPSIFPALKSPKETLEDFNAGTKGVGDSLSRLATSPNVKGRVACPISANGAPDCKAASDKLCQSKGFKQGKSLDTDSAQSCSAESLLTGRKTEASCRTSHYVTRALCQ